MKPKPINIPSELTTIIRDLEDLKKRAVREFAIPSPSLEQVRSFRDEVSNIYTDQSESLDDIIIYLDDLGDFLEEPEDDEEEGDSSNDEELDDEE